MLHSQANPHILAEAAAPIQITHNCRAQTAPTIADLAASDVIKAEGLRSGGGIAISTERGVKKL